MSAAFVCHNPSAGLNPSVLPFVWAIGADLPILDTPAKAPAAGEQIPVGADLSFYRRYTEAVLRRYVRMSMEAGKVPSLIGQEMFRGKVTNYCIGHFDDVVIFLHDVDRCLAKLDPAEQQLIARMSLQQYTVRETAELLGKSRRTILRHHPRALDHLTRVFLNAGMLESQIFCQGGTA